MWISPAYAQSGGDGGGLMTFLPLILIFVVFYFLLIRPQQKKAKDHRNMVDNVRRGDEVVTGGGIVGKITKVKDDNHIQIEIAEGVRINVVKGTLSDVRSKTAPAAGDTKSAANDSNGGGGGLMSKLGLKK
jgi:preprotein translocase subunit YajC